MIRKYRIAFSILVFLFLVLPFVRHAVQLEKSPDSSCKMSAIKNGFKIKWSGIKFYVTGGGRLSEPMCFKKEGKIFSIVRVPNPYERIFKRPIHELQGHEWKIGKRDKNTIIEVSERVLNKLKCRDEILKIKRKGKGIVVESCLPAVLVNECRAKKIPPDVQCLLREGESIYLGKIGMKLSLRKERGLLPGKIGKLTRLFPFENLILEVDQITNEKPVLASLKTQEGIIYPLKEGENSFLPVNNLFPLLPPSDYQSGRDIFLEKLIDEGDYFINKDGFYVPKIKGNSAKMAKKLGHWNYFKKQLNVLNKALGEGGIYSRLPCFRVSIEMKQSKKEPKFGEGMKWFYKALPAVGWKTSKKFTGWIEAEKKGNLICGEKWSPHFSGVRKRYFKSLFTLESKPEKVSLKVSPNAFLFINGLPTGSGQDALKSLKIGKNIISARVETKGMGKPNGILKIGNELIIKIYRRTIRKFPNIKRKGGVISDRDGFSLPRLEVLDGNTIFRDGDEIELPAHLVFTNRKTFNFLIGRRKYSVNIYDRNLRTRYFTYIRGNPHFKFGDLIVTDGKILGIFRRKKANLKIKIKGDYFFKIKNEKLFIKSKNEERKVEDGETFKLESLIFRFVKNRRGEISFPCHGLKGWKRCYSSIYSGLSSIIGMSGTAARGIEWSYSKLLSNPGAEIKLTIDDDLQELTNDILEEEILKLKRSEEGRTKSLRLRIEKYHRELERLRSSYKMVRKGKTAARIFSLEKDLKKLDLKYKKLKNPFYEGAILLMNQDGEIISAATYPYVPLRRKRINRALKKGGGLGLLNRCWMETYNPGSTFKLVDFIAFLERENPYVKKILRGFPFYGKGSENLRGKKLLNGEKINFDLRNFRREKIKYRRCSIEEAFANSYNVYFAYTILHSYIPALNGRVLAFFPVSLFRKRFPLLDLAEKLGFNRRYELSGGAPKPIFTAKSVFPLNAYKRSEIAHYSIGQAGLRATPLQLALIALSVYRKGVFVEPILIKEMKTRGVNIKIRNKKTRVFSRRTAYKLERAMNLVVREGTASSVFKNWPLRAKIFAKTGTAETSLYKDNSIFVGFFKLNRGKAVIFAVVLPRSGIGGKIAAPITKRLIESYIYYRERKREF